MNENEVDRLVDKLSRPIFVFRMNYHAGLYEGNDPRGKAKRRLVTKARRDIDQIVREYSRHVRD